MLLLITVSLSVASTVQGQNPICPLCSLGAGGLGFGQSPFNQGLPSLPSVVEAAPSFSSYSRNPLSMYQGDPAMFGTELGRAIAQRIQQLYAHGTAAGGGVPSSGSSSYGAYPDLTQQRPSTSSYAMDVSQPLPPITEAKIDFPAPSSPSRGGCPYCFGGGNSGYGSNAGYNSGGYAASPVRARRLEFVKNKKQA